jgi:hypothetical protein
VKKDLVKQACKEAFADEFINRLPEVSGMTPSFFFHVLTEMLAVLDNRR